MYLLIGAEQLSAREVYIGETEDVLERLKQHVAEKEFWQEAIFFTSKDESLTKSHVKYLESRLVERAKDARRYVVQNDRQPKLSGLPRADQDAMEDFLLQMPLLLGVLGHRVLDPLTSATTLSGVELKLMYAVKEATAFGTVTDEGFVVFKGSTALKGTTESISPGWTALKNELIAEGKLIEKGALLQFTDDVLFSSPSAAAAVIYGNSANGRISWKTESGQTLKEIEESNSK